MKKRLIMTILCVGMIASTLTACGSDGSSKSERREEKTEESSSVEESSKTEESSSAEEDTKTEESTSVEESSKTEESFSAEDLLPEEDSSMDILRGYAYRLPDGRMLTYRGVRGMYLDEYSLAELGIYMTFKDVEDGTAVEMETKKKYNFDALHDGIANTVDAPKGLDLDGIIIGEDYVVGYDTEQKSKMMSVHLEKDDIDFIFGFESDNLENGYESEIAKARLILDSLVVSNGDKTVDEYLRDTIEIGDYKFSDDVQFSYIHRGNESPYGFSLLQCKDISFRFELETKASVISKNDIFSMEQVDEAEFGDSIQIYLEQNSKTHAYKYLYVGIPDRPSEFLCVPGYAEYFDYGTEDPAEIEAKSRDYLVNTKLRQILVPKE